MNWIAFAILAYLGIVLQTTVTAFIAVHTVRPDLVALVAAYYALTARRSTALLACWCLGLGVDLCGLSYDAAANVGVSALAYGLAALLVVWLREAMFREHLLIYVFCVTLWIVFTGLLVGAHQSWATGGWARLDEAAVRSAWTAVYTAVLAPYAHVLLRRFRPILGLEAVRTYRVRS